MRTVVIFSILIVLAVLWGGGIAVAQVRGSPPQPEGRAFYMGFTPWPYAATLEARRDVYQFIHTEGDLIAHHIAGGIPFEQFETLDFNNYSNSLRDDIDTRIANTGPGKAIYLAIEPLNSARDALAGTWGNDRNLPRSAPWDSRDFDDHPVIQAYVTFSLVVIEQFRTRYGTVPKYFNYGVEISELMLKNPASYARFAIFAQTVYAILKKQYPDLSLMVSIAMKSPGSAEMKTVTAGFSQIKDFVDVVGISVYPYAFYEHADKGNPQNLPKDWLKQIKTIAPGKRYAVVETGWAAEDLNIPAYSLAVVGSEVWQKDYLEKLFQESQELSAETVIWFTSYDYNTLWNTLLGQDSVSQVWRDTGLMNESLAPRAALNIWRAWLHKPKS